LKTVGPDGFCVTEAGFGADIGMEKFFNIKCRASGLVPHCAVIVATVRALKMHGGGPAVVAGKPLADEYLQPNIDLVKAGTSNLIRHIENAKKFGVQVVVAINLFSTDTAEEVEVIRQSALAAGAFDAVESNHWAEGGVGAQKLATAVVAACKTLDNDNNTDTTTETATTTNKDFKLLYDSSATLKEKIEIVCKEMYRADSVEYSEIAEQQLNQYETSGFGTMPICMAKTQYSFSCDPKAKGAPTGFTVPIREVRVCAGAGFVYPICGDIMTIPGLSTRPGFIDVDIDVTNGDVIGLF
jgi:formyltetrahydrofolate synthetase